MSDWRDQARCTPEADHLLYPTGNGKNADKSYRKAIRLYCVGCLSVDPCLETAMSVERPQLRYGVWGATTPAERERLAKERATA